MCTNARHHPGADIFGASVIAQPTEPPCTDPYARWCDRESPRGPTYVDSRERTDPAARGFGEVLHRFACGGPPQDARDSRGDSQNNDSWGRWDCFATSLLAMTADSRATTRHEIHGEMALARPNAAAAATPPYTPAISPGPSCFVGASTAQASAFRVVTPMSPPNRRTVAR